MFLQCGIALILPPLWMFFAVRSEVPYLRIAGGGGGGGGGGVGNIYRAFRIDISLVFLFLPTQQNQW